jgi:hypothetical protein
MSEQNQQQDGNKVEKQIQQNLDRLAAVLGGKENLFPARKINNDAASEIASELLKERKEKTKEDVKKGLGELLDNKIEFDAQIKAKEKELEELKTKGKKAFNEKANAIFGKIDGIEKLEQNYLDALKSAGKETV